MDTLQEMIDHFPDAGEKPFLIKLEKEDRQTYTYADLSRNVRSLTNGLIRRGIQAGDVIGLFAPIDFAWTVVCLGALRAGAVVMPLDLQLEKETLKGIIEDSNPCCFFTDTGHAGRLRQILSKEIPMYLLDAADSNGENWERLLSDRDQSPAGISADDGAALFYTSGTTGPPKGVPLTHGNLVFQMEAVRQTRVVRDDDRALLPLPPHHVYPFVIGILVPLSLGITVVLPHTLTGPQMVRALQEGKVTVLFGVPRLYDALFTGIESRLASSATSRQAFEKGLKADITIRRKIGWSPGKWLLRPIRRRFAPKLRIMASGGAPLSPDLALKLEALGWQVAIGYGLTETAPLLTIKLPDDPHHRSVGRPVKGVEIRIDPEALPEQTEEQKRRGEGEILAKGPNVFSGYHNLPDKTKKVFTPDGWFRTGDLGYLDEERYLYVTGRVSTLIVTKGGENIQPDTIEKHLEGHPLIREAGVLQLDDGTLAAALVPELKKIRAEGFQDVNQAIQQAVHERSRELPSYQHVNDFALTRTPLPRTRLGKIRRHLLAEIFVNAKAGQDAEEKGPAHPVDISEMSSRDRILLENSAASTVWNWLANRYGNQHLSPDTSPEMDLGIDSMEWLNITLEIRRLTGIELEEEVINEIATVRDLLEYAADKAAAGEKAVSSESPLEEPEKMLSDSQMHWFEPLNFFEYYLARGLFGLNRLLIRRIFRLRVEGLENMPDQGPFILTPNHVSYLDAFVVAGALGFHRLRDVFWAGFTGAVFRNTLFRYIGRLSRAVPVDPEKGAISSMAFGAEVLHRKKGLIWFPEGMRSPTGRLQPFKTGVGVLLEHYPVPVIPAFIRGTEKILPPGNTVPRPGRMAITFGEPLAPEELAREGKGEEKKDKITSALHDEVAKLGKSMES